MLMVSIRRVQLTFPPHCTFFSSSKFRSLVVYTTYPAFKAHATRVQMLKVKKEHLGRDLESISPSAL